MTCDDYLAMLETLPVEELTYGAARDHATICHECNRVTRVVVEREQNMLMAYGHVLPSVAAATIAESAMEVARRRRTARLYSIGLGVAAAATVAALVGTRVVHRSGPARGMFEQEFALHCMSAGRAAGIVRANISDRLHTKLQAREPEGVLIVTGTPRTLQEARFAIDHYDGMCYIDQPAPPR
jgi:hypothetical protein